MKIIYSNHAQLRMIERAINKGHIKSVLDTPDVLLEYPDGRSKASKRLDDKVYSVVFKKKGDKIIVITVF